MKPFCSAFALGLCLCISPLSEARGQIIAGTNAPGQGTNFSFTVAAGATNFSLVISNSANVYSYLLVKPGGVPTETDFTWASRIAGRTNQINLEFPEFASGTYGLRVSTPAASATHVFQASFTTNRTDLRSAAYPVLKPLVFSTTGALTNSGAGAWHYFQVDIPSNLLSGWRLVLSSTNAPTPDLYVRRGQVPGLYSYDKASTGQPVDTMIFTSAEATANTYFIGVCLPAGPASTAFYTLTAELGWLTQLTWDPGTADAGTQVFTNQSATGGDYYFKVTTQTPANQAWRTALKVLGGEADLYVQYGSPAQTNSYRFASTRTGSDGAVLGQGYHFSPGQDWYLTVHATPGAQWTLLTGEAFVQQLPPLASDLSSSALAIIGPEGMRFFKTTISSNTLAWRLWMDLSLPLLISKTRAPLPIGSPGGGYQDWQQTNQMLVVPPYLRIGDQDLVGVIGSPGQTFNLISQQQPVVDLPFASTTTLNAAGYGYLTYRVQVPIEQIAWQVNLARLGGDPNLALAVRRDNVPNEFVNDAFSDLPGTVDNSVTMVPPTLSDGTFYITVYGAHWFWYSMTNGQPVITDVNYIFQVTNDAPARAGWRYYRAPNTAQQLGTYGWDLILSNQVPNTEIALRRNAVPGRWNYRNCSANCATTSTSGFADYSSTAGFLQRPGHQADIWYIGVYQPAAALGSFTLTGQELTSTPVDFDQAVVGGTATVTNQNPGRWQYFTFTVPTNTLGWELRLQNVTSGDPRLTVCRDRLPFDLGTHDYNGYGWYYPWISSSWPSGYSWGATYDWTDYSYDADGTYQYGKILQMGMGNPLSPGTYYVGVLGATTTPLNYKLVSRGFGPGFSSPVADVSYQGGFGGAGNFPARLDYCYRVIVPTNAPSWKIRLAVTNSEAMCAVQKDFLPNVICGNDTTVALSGGRKLQNRGSENYLLLPSSGQSNVLAGTYYVLVIGEGKNPNYSTTIGSNGCNYTFSSLGPAPTNQLGTLDPAGATDLTSAETLEGGEIKFYQFNVPPGVLALEVRLENRTNNPTMTLRADGQLPRLNSNYGFDFGQPYTWADDQIINIASPAATNYTLAVQAGYFGNSYTNASCTIRIHALTAPAVAFDGSVTTVANHTNGTWRYFQFTVPPDALGWDVRLANFSGDPRLVVCRDLPPPRLYSGTYQGSGWYYPWTDSSWPSSNLWAATYDWTEWTYDRDGTYQYGRILQMGMGNPLSPGIYYVGVFNGSGTALAGSMSYMLLSRGIGQGYSIPVYDLLFSGGVLSVNNLYPREAAYFRVQVPTGQPSWKLRLEPTLGDAMLGLQQNFLPNVMLGGSSPLERAGGVAEQRAGNDFHLLLPHSGATISNGTYYVLVASEGQNPGNGRIGTNSCNFTLQSLGPAPTNQLGSVDPSGTTDITYNDSAEGGEIKYYSFSVPPGTLSLEVHLENRVANPYMTLRADGQLPRGYYSYGQSEGVNYSWSDPDLINIASPAITNFTLAVQAGYFNSGYSNASYTVRLHALGLVPVAFDGGTALIVNQAYGTWQYFTITVPSGALGWDLRLTNVLSGDPRLVVRRAQLPDSLYTHTETGGGWYYPWTSASWPDGYQVAPGNDWTGYYYENNGRYAYQHILQLGMGNPLSPGTYYVGVFSGGSGGSAPMTYTLLSRGIGDSLSLPITSVPFIGNVTNYNLAAREAAYYRIDVPPNQPNWRLRLAGTSGESLLMLQQNALPSVFAGSYAPTTLSGGRKLQKAGNEHYLLLPASGQTNIPGGTFYLSVASEGQNPHSSYIGSNICSYVLNSYGPMAFQQLGAVGPTPLISINNLESGEINVYQFTVLPGTPAVEVLLDNRLGNPGMTLRNADGAPTPYYNYGYDGGQSYSWYDTRLLTLPNVSTGLYSLTIMADATVDAGYTLKVSRLTPRDLAFDASLSSPGLTNVASGSMGDLQVDYYRVTVPAVFSGQPVLGWKLDLEHTAGNPRLRARKDLLPNGTGYVGNMPYAQSQAILVPPYLTPGTWYVEVQAQGVTSYTLRSSALLLQRPAWQMPAIGQAVTTPGLSPTGPLFGDTGVATNGVSLPLDQGVDLGQGNWDYYAISVPSNNLGLLRTRLDAISGNPNLYLRAAAPPTLSHYLNGDYGSYVYDRLLNANIGSEYGNWVPINGRYETCLTPGTWYLAVQAAGNSNVRYRLRVYTGFVYDLTLNGLAPGGGSYSNQTIAGGDWVFYRAQIPTNSPASWNVTFSQELGDVVMYVRDRVPPGQGTSAADYCDWYSDNKNHGPYPSFDAPGVCALRCPPLRPGNTYYLGFRAIGDATFSVTCNTNSACVDYTNTVPFYGGTLSTSVPAYGTLKLRIDVPPDARRLILNFTNVPSFNIYLDQGSVPTGTTSDHWESLRQANPALNQALFNASGWPWLPGYMYFLLVTNTAGSAQTFAFGVDGRNCATDDYDNDGLPDCWELTYWPSIYSYNANSDPDGDGVRNLDEYLEGTDPTDPLSFRPRLLVNAAYGSVTALPAGSATTTPPSVSYPLGQLVQLNAVPAAGYGFLGWSGDASGTGNPLALTMNSHKTITAVFGVTNQPNADYQFQSNLHSSVGTPPDLADIAAGNAFVSDVVDGQSRTVYRFPQGSSVALSPANGVIPTNVYTMVLLFRFDNVSGWRRIIDVKNPAANYGLYANNGYLTFYGASASGPSASLVASNYAQVIITRDEAGNVACYANGVRQFGFVDSQNYATLSGSPQRLRFLKDDASEEGSGAIARIRLYDKVMPPAQVALLDRLPGGVAPPRFGAPVIVGAVLNLPAEVVPGVSYRLQASTNLYDWFDLSTTVPAASPHTFSDPLGPAFPTRFYRLASP